MAKTLDPSPCSARPFPGTGRREDRWYRSTAAIPSALHLSGGGGVRPRDGESLSLSSGEPPAVLVVDDSGGRYVWRDGCYWWTAG